MTEKLVGRRAVLRTAGVVGVGGVVMASAGCGSSDTESGSSAGSAASGGDGTAGGSRAAGSGVTVPVGDVPTGGGVVLASDRIVVTQPSAGQFKAFSAVCPHQGCTVSQVTDGLIGCPCHGSEFDITTGAVESGPASSGLTEMTASVSGGVVTVG